MIEGHEPPRPALPEILRALDDVWSSPCLAHVARFFPRPRVGTPEELRDLWYGGLRGVVAMIGGLYRKDGKRFFYVPPTTPDALSDEDRRALAPHVCAAGQVRCGNVGTFITRAEQAFDGEEARLQAWHAQRGWELCNDAAARAEGEPKPAPFEAWAQCVAGELPHTYRYDRSIELRAPERGWLVLRGRRGHYSFSDEVSAYDLVTGAAYSARSKSALVLEGAGVDFAAVDRQRKPEALTGNVLAEAARELAFVALTGRAIHRTRSHLTLVPVPETLAVTLSPRPAGFAYGPPDLRWGTSAQTELSFVVVDGDKLVADGSFTWPDSWLPAESRADSVLVALEAGLEKGCPRAKLPARLGRSTSSGASPIDADPGRQVGVASDLDRALEGLRVRACP